MRAVVKAVFGFALLGVPSFAWATGDACHTGVPDGWNVAQVRWVGDCVDSGGVGVLRGIDVQGKATTLFYGAVDNGRLTLGVVEFDGEGFAVVDARAPAHNDAVDPQSRIDAFRQAEKAAQVAADAFTKSGNDASAAFYATKAEMLASQLD